jgi:phosphatidylserine/phosphatidylglycerophosphate/cardiolipin synthase-like enzyme
VEEIIQLFIRSFEDTTFTSAERKAVRQLIEAYNPDRPRRDLLRSRIFDVVRTRLEGHPEIAALDWLETANKTLLERNLEEPAGKVYFSPGDACLQAILGVVTYAIHSLQVCVFTISDDRITRALLDARGRGVQVRILTDNEKLYDEGSDVRQLAATGIPVRVDNTPNHMHHKFVVADSKKVITGSYNWTRSAALYNHENVLVSADKTVVAAYEKEFAALWAEMTPFGERTEKNHVD